KKLRAILTNPACQGALGILPIPTKFQQISHQLFPVTGDFAVCETCRLGRGKCRRTCMDSEKIAGKCKLNFFCCRERI
ncbi:beta-defensin 35-like, partial [Grammomys surdaster]|uniref:beta-defensin 35-like n=1 Tax=Grammomys surdaster TaxID=491861 RepID=UPI00109F2D6A